MKILALDIGNQFLKAALFADGKAASVIHLQMDEALPSTLERFLDDAFFDAIGYTNVNKRDLTFLERLPPRFSNRLIEITGESPAPIRNCYQTPGQLGADRFAAAVAAKSYAPDKPVLVVGIGTAVTYDCVTAEGDYLGGAISLGLKLRFKALHQMTARLPLVEKSDNADLIANSTEEAIRSGVQNGLAAELNGMAEHYRQELGQDLQVFLTGGDSSFFEKQMKSANFAKPYLTPEGVYQLVVYQLNA